MEAEAKYTYVGAAVLALVVALVASVIWLKRTGGERDFARYTIYFREQALDGLSVGATVNMRGVAVGRVLDYQLSSSRVNQARVDIRIDRRTPVYNRTTAVITRNFVTGIAQVRLVNADPPGEPLTEPPDGERFPVIDEGRSDVAEITGRVNELGDMAGEVLQGLSLLLSTENRAAVATSLENLRDITGDLKRQVPALEKAIAEVGGAARDFRQAANQMAATVDGVGAGAGAALGDARVLIADLREATADTRRSLAQATVAINALQADASRTARSLDASVTQLDEQMLVAVGDLRASLDTMQRSLDRLADPRAALLGPERSRLGPGEKLR